ncbi:4-oxalocrotonate decarboxylase [Phytohabitans sp. ZYX-F-186]|uniref:4-oxalocrotonate decarboxylase n=1 Tax=Phytohabitans maris TaxID=3071409 RepID=A0ABU0ZEX5_9ACTN|nr:4-oxalocrotonate decarboxylase [Phytohabitans sp. ZYX-F-186]MDQ7904907.1 4-oxalocrotonate decarboxylase [Phytohabitans sp. ZYX-F-186]
MTAELAERLDTAALTATPIPQIASRAGLDAAAAYTVQEQLVARRLARGERLVGIKLGLTSRAKMAQVGVDEVIWGRLTDGMTVADGSTVDTSRLIHPRIEPEVAFLLDAAGNATAVAPALEVIDSRYADFRFALADVIVDNSSAAAYAIGSWRPVPDGVDNLGVLLEVDGRVVQIGSTAAILGDPRRAVSQGLRLAGRVEAGWVLLAGAATAAVPLAKGAYVRAVVEGLGAVGVRAS